MRVLFIGGTGTISSAVTELLAERGVDLTVLNRGRSELPAGVRQIRSDVADRADALAGETFDVVVNWIAYSPRDVETDIELFRGRVGQYVFISSATVYRKPSGALIETALVETAPLGNPDWQYAADKVRCEELLGASDLPTTIVRPSHTYSDTTLPTALDGTGYLIVDRLRRGKPVLVHDDGETLWTLTHNTDFAQAFAGLLGLDAAHGEAFHITSDEALSWNQITETIAAAVGVEPRIVHVPTDVIASVDGGLGIELRCDKAHSLVFDNTKIKRLVPGFSARVPLADGVVRSLAAMPRDVDEARDALLDRIAERAPR